MNVVKSEGIHRNVTVVVADKHGTILEEGDLSFVVSSVSFFLDLFSPSVQKQASEEHHGKE